MSLTSGAVREMSGTVEAATPRSRAKSLFLSSVQMIPSRPVSSSHEEEELGNLLLLAAAFFSEPVS